MKNVLVFGITMKAPLHLPPGVKYLVRCKPRQLHPSILRQWLAVCCFVFLSAPLDRAQPKFGNYDRQRGHYILIQVKDLLKKNYYDPTFHGLPIDALFDKADQMIARAQNNNEIWATIAEVLMLLDDSHTAFYPPSRFVLTNYGWEMQIIGDKCYVVLIEPGTDAEKQLTIGDQVLSLGGIKPTRENVWVLDYLYDTLRPMSGKHVVIQKVSGEQVTLDVMAKVQEKKLIQVNPYDTFQNEEAIRESRKYYKLHQHRFAEIGKDFLVWKMPRFDLSEAQVDSKMEKVRQYRVVALDLRGNRGGNEETLKRLLSHFFAQDLKIGDLIRRSGARPLVTKGMGKRAYTGKLIVLVDSLSASAAELFARVIQIEKRGIIVGDRTSGAVMRSLWYSDYGYATRYGVSITDADLVMNDGKRLEHVGVTPDELLIPSAKDLATKCDPVLANAASIMGASIDSVKAGTFFPVEWNR